MTQEKLAEFADLHRNYVVSIEGGYRNPTVGTWMKLCRALKCKPSDLFRDASL
ncbi:MAG: helix-turn-helix transcriptional regulator [Lentisphaerae bacterium]|nr:helix-turn-helix transcriptional regulator [Lentisphaerota bacterium]